MHGCIIWRCKPIAAKLRFHWIFRTLPQLMPIPTPQWPFSGKSFAMRTQASVFDLQLQMDTLP